jgi:tetratricopeptide (TPR) repeat protein
MYAGRRRFSIRILLVCCAAVLAGGGQVDPRAALLERAGFEALNAGRIREAADAFREGVAADPKNARLHLGAGMAAALQQRDTDARDALERAIALDPRLTPARVLLGQIQHRMGDVAAAIRTYETVLADAPDQRDVKSAIDTGSAKSVSTRACSWRSAPTSRCRSKVRPKPRSPPKRSKCWTARTGASARCSARFRSIRFPSCSTRRSSFAM